MIELKPCPFCGAEAHTFVDSGVRVICPKCGASSKCLQDGMTPRGVMGDAIKSVVDAWNKRVCDEDLQKPVGGI